MSRYLRANIYYTLLCVCSMLCVSTLRTMDMRGGSSSGAHRPNSNQPSSNLNDELYRVITGNQSLFCQTSAIRNLVTQGADINCRFAHSYDMTPLMIAISRGSRAIANLLVCGLGADVKLAGDEDYTLMHYAVFNGDAAIIEFVINLKDLVTGQFLCPIDDANKEGITPLMMAAEQGNMYAMNRLIKCGADAMKKSNNGYTLLHWAVVSGHIDVINYVLNMRNMQTNEPLFDINMQTADGRTAAMIAAQDGHNQALRLLLSRADLDLTLRSKRGSSLLHYAALNRNDEIEPRETIVGIVLSHRLRGRPVFDVNDRSFLGMTPLMIAARDGRIHGVQILIGFGAHAQLKNIYGQTAMDLAANSQSQLRIELDDAHVQRAIQLEDNVDSTDLELKIKKLKAMIHIYDNIIAAMNSHSIIYNPTRHISSRVWSVFNALSGSTIAPRERVTTMLTPLLRNFRDVAAVVAGYLT